MVVYLLLRGPEFLQQHAGLWRLPSYDFQNSSIVGRPMASALPIYNSGIIQQPADSQCSIINFSSPATAQNKRSSIQDIVCDVLFGGALCQGLWPVNRINTQLAEQHGN